MDKNRVVIILSGLVLASFVFSIGSCVNAYNQSSARKKEMFNRMEIEEKSGKLALENANAAGKLKELQKQLEQETAANLETKKILAQEQLMNSSLKEDLQKLSKDKEALEEELKKQLAFNKKARK
ncbi:MAG: hypothetical protein PHY88_05335 [Candidatus Omnitrophica bacterium]|jgi:hypothetical protein|nr:hypothetical protein [Candidatus Omnitrophota bacterium]